jgi:hypothetical protein
MDNVLYHTMSSGKAPARKKATIFPDRGLKALAQQLDTLQRLKNRTYQEADSDETEWQHLTEGIIEAAFGDPSAALSKFYMARAAGQYSMRGIPPEQRQVNFELRIKEHEALLRSLINTLRLRLPEEEVKGVYEPGEEYTFYRDLSSLMQTAIQQVLVIDPYLHEESFNLYVSKVSANAAACILSKEIGPNVVTVARMYAKSRPLELRSSPDIHDRAVFIDHRGWVIGQSIKDAARKKPTYMLELNEPLLTASRGVYSRIWAAATVII